MTNAKETTTNRTDFTWPFLAERQRIFDWDRYEYKERRRHNDADRGKPRPILVRNAETLMKIPYQDRLRFDFDFLPKPILSQKQSVDHYPTEKVIKYDKDKADARSTIQRTRPRVFKCPQISLDDLPADRRDMACIFTYSTSKTMSELTSGVLESRPIPGIIVPSKPFGDPGKFQQQPLYKNLHPGKNWRRVSIEWDEKQNRIFGGRSVD